jgi:hypothetical protein
MTRPTINGIPLLPELCSETEAAEACGMDLELWRENVRAAGDLDAMVGLRTDGEQQRVFTRSAVDAWRAKHVDA